MHMRRKKWARPELAACPYFIDDDHTAEHKNQWRSLFIHDQPMMLELGCGKGVSTAQMVHDNPATNFVAVDISRDVLGVARRNLANTFGQEPIDNVRLTAFDILHISDVFGPADCFKRIYISFCNPWSEKRAHEKRRLTHPRQLEQYKTFLADDGEIWFKTDDERLFTDSIDYLNACGYAITQMIPDLHASGFAPNYISEHEQKFSDAGIPIKFLIARKCPDR